MNSFYYKTFARVCLLPYIGGTIIHLLRLIYNFTPEMLPVEVDWVIVSVGGYASLGLIIYISKIPFKNIWDKIAYGWTIFHLGGSVLLHAYILFVGNHHLLNIFPYWYSYLAVAYFLATGLYVLNLNKRLYQTNNNEWYIDANIGNLPDIV